MSYDENLAKRIRTVFAKRTDVVEKKMFGGLCPQPHARPMDFTGRPLAGMVYVEPEGLRNAVALAKWVGRGVSFVSSLPAKAEKGRKNKSVAKSTPASKGATPPMGASAKPRDQMKRDPAIDEYLAGASPRNRALLQKLRKAIHMLVPQAEECISYRLPAFRFDGRIIAGFSATSTGCSYYPFSGTTLKTLAADIAGYGQTKSALHFGPDEPETRTM